MWEGKAGDLFVKLEPLANSLGLKIVELDVPVGSNGVFRVYVDSLDGNPVPIDKCSDLSPVISRFLDVEDPFSFRYYLEVSSPGLDRPIRRFEEVKIFVGKKVKLKLKTIVEGRKRIIGVLADVNDDEHVFTITSEDGHVYTIKKDYVRKMNVIWEGA